MLKDSPHGRGSRMARMLWGVVWLALFRPSPRNMHWWRNMLLRLFGAKLHPTARIYPRARCWAPWNLRMGVYACVSDDVDVYCVDRITIGDYSTVSQYSYLCGATHEFEHIDRPLIPRPIVIGRRCWIAADVFVAPGVTISDGVVVGARSSVFRDLPPWTVCVGTPAKPLRPRTLGPADYGEDAGEPCQEMSS
jgi:putative colanic acid biosynthesis acetyltransferase WcaF